MTITTPLPRSTPAAEGIDPTGLRNLLDGLGTAGIEMHSLMVLRHGQVITEGWWAPYAPDTITLLYSLSKSFTSTAAGLAVTEGLLSVEDRVLDHFPEITGPVDPRLDRLLVHHLLSMSTGHREDTMPMLLAAQFGADTGSGRGAIDLVRAFFALPADEEPGSVFCYHNTATYLLAVIVQRVTAETLGDYLTPRLFAPLGITDLHWSDDGDGHHVGFTGLHLTTESIARFGQLYLQRGQWEGRQLIPADWVDRATRVQTPNADNDGGPDWRQGYGYQFWMARHGYRGDGAHGQFCLLLPDQDAVVAITSATTDMQVVLDQVWEHLLPAMRADGSGVHVDLETDLADRLAALSLPDPARQKADPGGAHQWRPAPPWSTDPAPNNGFEAPTSTSPVDAVQLTGAVDDRVLVLTVAGRDHCLSLGLDEWRHGVLDFGDRELSVATRGGWASPDEFSVDVVLVNTPHLLRLRCRDGQFQAEYNVPVLGSGRLAELALPRDR